MFDICFKLYNNAAPNTSMLYYHFPTMTGLNPKFKVQDILTETNKLAPSVMGCKFTDTDFGDFGD